MVTERSIIFYDGECGLCNGAVRFALKRDRRSRLAFSPIGGETWTSRIGPVSKDDQNSLHLINTTGHYRRSAAVVRLLYALGGGWEVLGVLLWLIPLPIRNIGYRLIAATRYRLFGRTDSCKLDAMGDHGCILP